MLTAIQILLVVFILFAITRVYLRVRERVISVKSAFFWSTIWFVATIIILLPQTTQKMATFFGVGRGVDIVLYLSLALIFYLIFRVFVLIEDVKHEITEVVRQIALKNPKVVKRRKK